MTSLQAAKKRMGFYAGSGYRRSCGCGILRALGGGYTYLLTNEVVMNEGRSGFLQRVFRMYSFAKLQLI